jgi:predicted DCC family thiol-disulfide oxidoreductase YuxK
MFPGKLFLSMMQLSFVVVASRIGACRAFVAAPRGRMGGVGCTAAASSTTTPSFTTPDVAALSPPSVVLDRVFDVDRRPIILFDGVCNMCNNAVNLALDWDPSAKLRFAALQSNVGRALLRHHGRSADDISSIVLVTPEGAYVKSDAVLGIAESLNPLPMLPMRPFAKLAVMVVPQFLRDLIYDGVADNRYSIMGKRNECRFDADGEYTDRFVDDSLAME